MEREREFNGLKPFPVVKLVDKLLDAKWAAQYRESARPPRIELGTVLLTFTRDQRRVAVVHEIGHWLRCEHLPRPKGGRKGEEEFAESFASYFISPRTYRQGNPQGFAQFEMLMRNGVRRKLEAFEKQIMRELDSVAA